VPFSVLRCAYPHSLERTRPLRCFLLTDATHFYSIPTISSHHPPLSIDPLPNIVFLLPPLISLPQVNVESTATSTFRRAASVSSHGCCLPSPSAFFSAHNFLPPCNGLKNWALTPPVPLSTCCSPPQQGPPLKPVLGGSLSGGAGFRLAVSGRNCFVGAFLLWPPPAA